MNVSAPATIVLNAIDSMRDEIIRTTQELVRIRSVNPGYPGADYQAELGGETNVNRHLRSIHEPMGLASDPWAETPGRENLVSIWRGTGGGRSLIHNGHVDTVPTGLPEQWHDGDPLSGRLADGRIYGRGACDMKGPIVCQLMALRALQKANVRLQGDVLLATTVGEENMDSATIGAGALKKRGHTADAAVISEPSAPPYPLGIVPISPALWWLTITVEGKASHAATRGETIRAGGMGSEVAVSAIDKGVYLIEALRRLEDQWGQTKRHPLFRPGHFSLLPGVIRGGPHGVDVPFFIPDYCTIDYCIWHHPHEPAEQVQAEVESYLQRASALDDWLRAHPPKLSWRVHWPSYEIEVGHPLCQSVARAHEAAAQGTPFAGPARFAGFYAVSDAAFITQQGIPSVMYGPGSLLVAHAPNEYVEVEELMVATKAFALLTMDWCGVSS